MEVGELGLYLLVACVVTRLLEHPASIVRQSISSSVARRVLMGLVMGDTRLKVPCGCNYLHIDKPHPR